jgi:hypothetical protein
MDKNDFVPLTENIIQDLISYAGVAILSRSKNSSSRVFPVNCPYCNDNGGHGGLKKTTGSYHCFKCHHSTSLWGFVLDAVGKERAIKAFIDVGIFKKERLKVAGVVTDDAISVLLKEYDAILREHLYGATDAVKVITEEAVLPVVRETYFPLDKMVGAKSALTALMYLIQKRKLPAEAVTSIMEMFPFYWLKDPPTDEREKKMVNRILVPVYIKGELHSWTGRATLQSQYVRYMTPKLEDTKTVCQHTVYPFDFLIKQKGDILLIQEGIFDSLPINLTSRSTGVYGVTVFTNNVTPTQIEWLKELAVNFRHVVIALDRKEWAQSVKVFTALGHHIPNLWGTWCPSEYKDFGEYPFESVEAAVSRIKLEVLVP